MELAILFYFKEKIVVSFSWLSFFVSTPWLIKNTTLRFQIIFSNLKYISVCLQYSATCKIFQNVVQIKLKVKIKKYSNINKEKIVFWWSADQLTRSCEPWPLFCLLQVIFSWSGKLLTFDNRNKSHNKKRKNTKQELYALHGTRLTLKNISIV
jgi:hypothetical protein